MLPFPSNARSARRSRRPTEPRRWGTTEGRGRSRAEQAQRMTMRESMMATPPHQLRSQRSSCHGNRPTATAINWMSADQSTVTSSQINTPRRKRTDGEERKKTAAKGWDELTCDRLYIHTASAAVGAYIILLTE